MNSTITQLHNYVETQYAVLGIERERLHMKYPQFFNRADPLVNHLSRFAYALHLLCVNRTQSLRESPVPSLEYLL